MLKKKSKVVSKTLTKTSKPSALAKSLPAMHPLPANHHTVVENLQPTLEHYYPIKAIPGEKITVTADIFRDGHGPCEAILLVRKVGAKTWQKLPFLFVDNDGFAGEFIAGPEGEYEFTVQAQTQNGPALGEIPFTYNPSGKLRVDSPLTQFSAWYEMWGRSQGSDPNKSASFADMESRLPAIAQLGFDVIYLTPLHPIGRTKRKGRNNSLTALPGEPGCPYAIGNEVGGHKQVDPELGTLKDCEKFLARCQSMGFNIALDFALNCSPDHPYVKDHPDWFYREKDGTIKCAENPPKRYEDVYPLNFFCNDKENLWMEIKSILEFWVDRGITIFRVDNPHTKPFGFWEWVIREIKTRNPEIIFLAEAFTKPKVMKRLAKIGFDLSYTYFTWRTESKEIQEYVEELTQQAPALFMKGIFFPTTPDILPLQLQNATPAMFKIRFALAATLVGSYGMYNGYELCEGTPYPGKEEYGFSEKYQYKVWDWDRPGHIKPFIQAINTLRKEYTALQFYKNIHFHKSNNPQLVVYSKTDEHATLLFVVNLDPLNTQNATLELDLSALELQNEKIYGVYDLLSHESYVWSGAFNYVELNPHKEVMHILKLEKF